MAEITIPYEGPLVTRAEAKADGAKYYFTGKPCKRGHVDIRFVSNACCRRCANLKVIERRKSDRGQKYIKSESARVLARKRNQRYRDAHRERKRAEGAAYRSSDRGKAVIRAKTRRYAASEAGKRTGRASSRKYAQTKQGRLMRRLNEQNRRARKLAGGGKFSAEDLQALLTRQKKCHICMKRFTIADPATIDHVVPLARGGLHDVTNIALAHRSCNAHKQARRTHLI